MPRKKYEKKIVPYMQAYPKMNADKTYESLKKESAKFVGVLEKWMEDQVRNGDPDEVEIWEETLFPGVEKAKTYRSKIYAANKKIAQIEIDSEIARVSGDNEKVEELKEAKNEQEEKVAGICWRIYRIYSFIRPQIVLGNTDTRGEEYEETQIDPEKVGTI